MKVVLLLVLEANTAVHSILFYIKIRCFTPGAILISVRSLQRSEQDFSDPLKYLYSWSTSLDKSI